MNLFGQNQIPVMQLKRSLSLVDLVVYGVGVIIGAGIYVLIGSAAGLAGNFLWLSFIFGALIAIFTGLSYAELSSVYSKEAAEYFFIKEIFKSRFLAFLTGWLVVSAQVVGISAVALGFSSYFNYFFHFNPLLVASLLIFFLNIANYLGIELSSKVNFFLTGVAVLGLLVIIAFFFSQPSFDLKLVSPEISVTGIFEAAVLVFFAYIGFEGIVNLAEETKNPNKNIPRALVLSIAITSLIYIMIGLVSVSTIDYKTLAGSNAPLSLVASRLMGDIGSYLITFAALLSTASTVLILSIVSSRILWGMARDKSLPKILSKIDKHTKTPHFSIFTVTLISILLVMLLGKIEVIAEISTFNMLVVYFLINFSLIWFRLVLNKVGRFKSPLNLGKVPLTPIFGTLTISILFTFITRLSLIVGIIGLCFGIILYLIVNAKRVSHF